MQFSTIFVAAATFALAQAVEFTNPSFNSVTAGEPFNITWSGASGPVTLTLKDGPPNALITVSVISSGLSGNSFVWSVPATLTADTYAIQIDDSTHVPNYSEQFQLIGGVASSSSASSAATSSGSLSGSSTSSVSTSQTSSSSSSESTISSSSSAHNSTATVSSSSNSSSASKTSSGASSTASKTTSAATSASSTSAPSMASVGYSSPLALVFLALAAIMTLN